MVVSIVVDNCYLLDYNALKKIHQMLILVNLLRFYLNQRLFFVLPNNFIVSGDKNCSLYPVFTLKTIMFLILLGYICKEEFSVKKSRFLMINSK